jgi:hypothetical protein
MYIWDHLREKINYKQTNGYHRQIITNNRAGPLEKKTRKKNNPKAINNQQTHRLYRTKQQQPHIMSE